MSWSDSEEERRLANEFIAKICLGGGFSGAVFSEVFGLGDTGPYLQALIDWPDERRYIGHARLHLEGRWRVVDGSLDTFPVTEDEIPAMSVEEQLLSLWRLRGATITSASMPDVAPHLVLGLSDGRTFFVWGGMCNHLEPWQLEYDHSRYLLVCKGWAASIWMPEGPFPPKPGF
jgi:hypothetical protein